MMRVFKMATLFLCVSISSCISIQYHEPEKIVDPFEAIEFDKAVAYDFTGDTDVPLLDSNQQLTKTITSQVVLDTNQLNNFKAILMDSTNFGGTQTKDFYPHLGIVFYKNNKIIQSLEISLPCNAMLASFKIQLLNKMKFPDNGFSKKGRQSIYNFCKALGFRNYLEKLPWSDPDWK